MNSREQTDRIQEKTEQTGLEGRSVRLERQRLAVSVSRFLVLRVPSLQPPTNQRTHPSRIVSSIGTCFYTLLLKTLGTVLPSVKIAR